MYKRQVCKDENDKILEDMLSGNTAFMNRNTYYMAEPKDISPNLEEVSYVIKNLKHHKALRTDKIMAELLKYGREDMWKRMHCLITLVWRQLKIPNGWLVGIIQPTCKKEDKVDCSNYMPIMLLTVICKLISGVI